MSRFLVALCLTLTAAVAQAAPHPFGFDDMIQSGRIESFDASRDGKWVAYSVKVSDVATSKTQSAIWIVATSGGQPRRVTDGTKHDTTPHFFPDGKRLAYLSDRDGASQLYVVELGGGAPRALTHVATGVDDFVLAPDGKFALFSSAIYVGCETEACNAERVARAAKPSASGRVIERSLYRHWDTWADGKRSHVFRLDLDGQAAAPRDLTPGNWDVPEFAVGGTHGFDVAPDGKTVAYSSKHAPDEASSTNVDIFEIPATGGEARCLTSDNPAFDGTPRYSPDGKWLAYRAQHIPSYESDKFELVVLDRASGKRTVATPGFDDWVEETTWSPDSKRVYFTSIVLGHKPIYAATLDGKAPTVVTPRLTAADPIALADGSILFARTSFTRPTELWRAPVKGAIVPVTHVNDALYAGVTMGQVSERWYSVSDGKKVHAWLITPPGFDPKKKHPALMWVHGGPESSWEDGWSYRWNPEVLASAGYVMYLPDPRGSTGYGQEFVRGVLHDWGGKPFDDLLRGVDDLESLPFVDKARVGAAGASYGGFMMNWFQGHTDRFQALFCHDGIADQPTQFATEELWFPEYEFNGPPWSSSEYRKWSPIESAAHFKTPQMIVHGEKDYRIPVAQAYLMFNTLLKRGIPARMLVFPDENHWVLKAANSRLWYAEMIDWFHQYLGGAAADPKALETAYSVTK